MQNCGVVVIVTVVVPSLHHRKEGWPRDQENIAKPPRIARTGWFSLITNGKPPRLPQRRLLRDIFLMTHPPLLAVMQGGEYARLRVLQHPQEKGGKPLRTTFS